MEFLGGTKEFERYLIQQQVDAIWKSGAEQREKLRKEKARKERISIYKILSRKERAFIAQANQYSDYSFCD